MAGLPREVVHWLLSLGILNNNEKIKWSVYNGTLPATVLNRYFPSKVNLNVIVNEYATLKREGNWRKLESIFHKLHLHIRSEVIESVLNCKRGSVNVFLQELHAAITRKKFPLECGQQPKLHCSPPYARETAVCIVRNNMHTAEALRSQDIYETEKKITALLIKHRQMRALERMQQPERFTGNPPLYQACRRLNSQEYQNKVAKCRLTETKKAVFNDHKKTAVRDKLENNFVLQPHQQVEFK